MFSIKQYIFTLIVAVVAFGAVFAWAYVKTTEKVAPDTTQTKKVTLAETPDEILASPSVPTILPHTKITLITEDMRTHKRNEAKISPSTLLGLTQEEVADEFSDYTVEAFNEKEVRLIKNYESEEIADLHNKKYILGVDGNNVCIKDAETDTCPVKVDYEVTHLSKYIYSMLLSEEIEITNAQKEALLLNPNTIQKILQGYMVD